MSGLSDLQEKLIVLLFSLVFNLLSPTLEELGIINPSPTPTPTPAQSKVLPSRLYEIKRVVDGDTLVVSLDNKNQTIRLIGVDSPESVDPRRPVECFGKEASEFARKYLIGQKIFLETDPTQDTYDRYNRLLAYIFLENGTNFNQLIIQEGYAHEYTYERPYKYQTLFKQAEEDAKLKGKGLWGVENC